MADPDVGDAILMPALRRWLQQHVLAEGGHSMELAEMVIRRLAELAARGDEEAMMRVAYLQRAARDLADMEANLLFLHGVMRDASENLTR